MRGLLVLAGVAVLVACGDPITTDRLLESESDVTLHGRVTHDVDAPHTGAGPFEIGPETHATIILVATIPDSGSFPLASSDAPITTLPFAFTLVVEASALADARDRGFGMISLSARVLHAAGPTVAIGDLVTERSVGSQPIDDIELVATKLEACDEPGAGGFCI